MYVSFGSAANRRKTKWKFNENFIQRYQILWVYFIHAVFLWVYFTHKAIWSRGVVVMATAEIRDVKNF